MFSQGFQKASKRFQEAPKRLPRGSNRHPGSKQQAASSNKEQSAASRSKIGITQPHRPSPALTRLRYYGIALSVPVLTRSNTPWARGPANFGPG